MARFILVLLALAVAAPARANVSRRDFPGVRTGEPGGLREIAIEHETLAFDLRPLADRGSARIAATYELDNHSTTPISAPLVFVSGMSRVGDCEVRLDGKLLRGDLIPDEQVAKFPATWNPPASTPAIDGGAPIGFENEKSVSIGFAAEIPPGRHTLAITYSATPALTRSHGGATILWQVGYVLAPARDWDSFGTLDVTVELPVGWRVATSLALARTGSTLRGKFTGLPADTIGISASARLEPTYMIARIVLPMLVLFVLLAGGYALFWIGRARGRGPSLGPTWPLAFGCAMVWGTAIAFAGGFMAMSSIGVPSGQSAAHGYSALPGLALTVLGSLLSLPIGFMIVRMGIRRGTAVLAE